MKVLIRVDSSLEIGSGHIIRCLNLAKKLHSNGFTVTFICRDNVGGYQHLVLNEGFELILITTENYEVSSKNDNLQYAAWLPVSQEKDACDCQDAIENRMFDWLIVDHYALDYRWQNSMRNAKLRIMVIDDLADRKHQCDILLDQNFYIDMEDRYINLVPKNCVTLLGPQYLLLDQQYEKYQNVEKIRSTPISKILVFFGAVDLAHQTQLVLDTIPDLGKHAVTWDIVVGSNNPQRNAIKDFCEQFENIRFHCQVRNMSELIFDADLAIGAGGMSGWERCKLGLPSITTIVADNQIEATESAEQLGVLYNLGHYNQVTKSSYIKAIHQLLEHSEGRLKAMSENCYNLFKVTDVFDTPNLLRNYRSDAI